MSFADLGLTDNLLRAIGDAGYEQPTPIQEQAIPYVLMNRDMLGCAQTGTGKTASFVLPMLDILSEGRARARMPRSLILEPTRELAAQVSENFEVYGKYQKLSMALLIGGVSFDDQERKLDRGVDVLIATPGRLLDHFERGKVLLSDVKIVVIDEADRMLDMGFIPDVERIVKLMPKLRQTLMFSATMPKEIRRLADKFLMNPKEITVSPPATTAETVQQGLIIVDAKEKRNVLRSFLTRDNVANALIFCNRKRDIGVLHRSLKRHGFDAGALHGDMDQFSRMDTLEAFKAGKVKYLVCSDVAARGLDIQAMSHVFNFDVPTSAEDYVHRIGRTGRAGRKGKAITIATPEDSRYLGSIKRLTGQDIPRLNLKDIGEAKTETKEPERDKPGRNGKSERPSGRESNAKREARPEKTRKKSEPNGRQRERAPRPAAPAPAQKPASKPAQGGAKPVGFGDDVPAFLLRSFKVG
ncbi:MAG: DEAD/DEAH box helicase [Alphaproteobacteria bacterium]|nr:DEAD/DEAH box helicase [Alphaproteobacteria bacterium]